MNDDESWSIEDARARFDEFLDACLEHGPQALTRSGVRVAVLVPAETWNRMRTEARPTLKELLLGAGPHAEPLERVRGKARRRPIHRLSRS